MTTKKEQTSVPPLALRVIQPTIRIASFGEIEYYPIRREERERLASGTPESTHLNFALALLPVSLTLLVTLQTATISSTLLRESYQIAFWMTLIHGTYFLVRWLLNRRKSITLVREILLRMPPPLANQIEPTPTPIQQ